MPKINIDELVKPIEVVVGGKTYTIEDIPQATAKRMNAIGVKAKKAEEAGDTEDTSTDEMAAVLAEILGAKPEAIAALGMRKLLALITGVMGEISAEIEGKNSPKVAARK